MDSCLQISAAQIPVSKRWSQKESRRLQDVQEARKEKEPMIINSPCIITARLLPGVRMDDAFISIEYGGWHQNGRQWYRVFIDTPDFEHIDTTVSSGVGGGTLQQGLRSFFSFAAACGESMNYEARTGRKGDNADLFNDQQMREWCAAHEDELSMLSIELEETPNLIEE